MKKMAVLVAGILAAGAVFAADASTSSAIVSNAKAKIEFKASAIKMYSDKSKKKDAKDITTTSALVLGIDDKTGDTVGNGDYEPNTTVELSGNLFKTVDAKLTLKANKDKDASQLELSKTVGDTSVTWTSDIDFSKATLFSALTTTASLKVKKTMKMTEAQIKAKVYGGRLAIDTESEDTYIKVTPFTNFSATLKPYDADWKVGSEFEIKDVEDFAFGNSSLRSSSLYCTNGLTSAAKPGVLLEYALGTTGKVFWNFGRTDRATFTKNDNASVETTDEIATGYGKLGVELTPNADTKVVAVILGGAENVLEYNKTSGTEMVKKVTANLGVTDINVDAETKMGSLKLEGEANFKLTTLKGSYVSDVSGNKSQDVTGQLDLGLFGKVSVVNPDLAPYASVKGEFMSNGKIVKNAAGTETNNNTDGSSKFTVALGAEKTVEALKVGAELKAIVYSGKSKDDDKIDDTKDTEKEYSAFGLGLGVKATYEF